MENLNPYEPFLWTCSIRNPILSAQRIGDLLVYASPVGNKKLVKHLVSIIHAYCMPSRWVDIQYAYYVHICILCAVINLRYISIKLSIYVNPSMYLMHLFCTTTRFKSQICFIMMNLGLKTRNRLNTKYSKFLNFFVYSLKIKTKIPRDRQLYVLNFTD